MKNLAIVAAITILILPATAMAHPGNTDSSGCHTCRTNCASWGLSKGEYHCHNSKGSSQPLTPITSTWGDNGTGYTTPTPKIPDCPLYSTYNHSSETCKCNSGYIANNNGSGCISNDDWCKNQYGYYAKADYSGSCECSYGYILVGGTCITHTKNCENSFGSNVTGIKGDGDNSSCSCNTGYQWDSNRTKCEKIPEQKVLGVKIDGTNKFIEEEKGKISKIDNALSNRLKGRILLQVENNGEAWYVSPKDGKKYYMADGQEAYTIMRRLGVGITNKDLEKIKADKNFAKKHSGKIFLQVQANGEAYYIDINGNNHYLKDGESAYEAMRNLGLGIANSDLRKIDINTVQ